tara:strand:+ start:308 stop:643 length:336 start_codon:yes stop_codon:yes gene_type:complete
MANIYKNANYNLTTTNVTDVYTCPSNSRSIVKKIHCVNYGAGNHSIEVFLYDSSNTTQYQIAQHSVNAGDSQGIADGTFILEENDVLRLQSSNADHFSGTVAILEMNREDR